MKNTRVTIESMAGNTEVSLTVYGEPQAISQLLDLPYVNSLYEWRFPTKAFPYHTILVDVKSLGAISQVLADLDIELFHIHDF